MDRCLCTDDSVRNPRGRGRFCDLDDPDSLHPVGDEHGACDTRVARRCFPASERTFPVFAVERFGGNQSSRHRCAR